MDLEIRHLRLVAGIADAGTMTAAADRPEGKLKSANGMMTIEPGMDVRSTRILNSSIE